MLFDLYCFIVIADYSFKVVLGEHDAHKPLLVLIQANDPDIQVSCLLCDSQQLTSVL